MERHEPIDAARQVLLDGPYIPVPKAERPTEDILRIYPLNCRFIGSSSEQQCYALLKPPDRENPQSLRVHLPGPTLRLNAEKLQLKPHAHPPEYFSTAPDRYRIGVPYA